MAFEPERMSLKPVIDAVRMEVVTNQYIYILPLGTIIILHGFVSV